MIGFDIQTGKKKILIPLALSEYQVNHQIQIWPLEKKRPAGLVKKHFQLVSLFSYVPFIISNAN